MEDEPPKVDDDDKPVSDSWTNAPDSPEIVDDAEAIPVTVTQPETVQSPLDAHFVDNVRAVLFNEGVPTLKTIIDEVAKRTSHVAPKSKHDKHLRDSIKTALVEVFKPDGTSNEAKTAVKRFLTADIVMGKFATTFIASDIMLVAITQFIRKRVDIAVREFVDKQLTTVLRDMLKVSADEKPTGLVPIVKTEGDTPTDIVVPDEESTSSASHEDSAGPTHSRHHKRSSKSRHRSDRSKRNNRRFPTDSDRTTDHTSNQDDGDDSTDTDDTGKVRQKRQSTKDRQVGLKPLCPVNESFRDVLDYRNYRLKDRQPKYVSKNIKKYARRL